MFYFTFLYFDWILKSYNSKTFYSSEYNRIGSPSTLYEYRSIKMNNNDSSESVIPFFPYVN